ICFIFRFSLTPPSHLDTLSLHDALPICQTRRFAFMNRWYKVKKAELFARRIDAERAELRIGKLRLVVPAKLLSDGGLQCETKVRSEEHTSELQSRENLVCRLLLEKKKKK